MECNESDRRNALHGFSPEQAWEVIDRSDTEVTLTTRVGGREGYPWLVDLHVTYRAEVDGVSVHLSAKNTSDTPAPFGAAFHPYLVFPASHPSEWTLTMSAQSVVVPDGERLLPVEQVDVADTDLDYRQGGLLDASFLDHAFGGFTSEVAAEISDPAGRVIRVEASENCPWMQIHKPVDGPFVGSVVVEPQSCPPNGFSSARDVIELSAGESVSMRWRVSAIAGGEVS